MLLSRNGKIARLPKPIRAELNRRLDQGTPGGPLLQWLNSLPEVQSVLAADFGGRPINKQSLSQWRHGGHAEWLRQQETRTLAGQILTEARELQPAGRPPLTDQLASWVLIRYLMVVRKLIGQTGAEKADFQLLHQFSRDLMAFQRGDHAKARLQFEWVRFKLLSGLQPVPAAPCPEPPKTEAGVDHASRITYHAPASDPVRPSQTFEIFNKPVEETTLVVAQVSKPAVSPVSKPACHGHAKSLPNNHPATPFYSARLCRPALPSASVRPSQTFEFLNFPMNSERVGEKSLPSWPRISEFGFLSDFGLRPSDFPSPSAPVRPGQTFEILNKWDAHWDPEPSQTRSGAPEGRPSATVNATT